MMARALMREIRLGVNIDHVATIRQARGVDYPDPLEAALAAERGGAGGITVHLREDRRHIQDRDVRLLRPMLQSRMNLEMGLTEEMLGIALDVRPHDVCLVPEKRAEITTEGGLDVAADVERVAGGVKRLTDAGIRVALFIAPDLAQVEAAKRSGAPVIELHTGTYADAAGGERARELGRLSAAAKRAASLGLEVHAGHGLTYHNVQPVAAIAEIVELNIGHCIIARAIFSGLEAAVRDMKTLMIGARQ